MIRFPRSIPLVSKIEESSNPHHWFLILKWRLISTVEPLRWSRLLKPLDDPDHWLLRVLIGQLGSFCSHFYIKGWLDLYFFFFTHFFGLNSEPNKIFFSLFARNSQKLSSLSIFELSSLCFTFPAAFHQRAWRHPRLSYDGVRNSPLSTFSFCLTYSLFQVNFLTLHLLVILEFFNFLILHYL